MTESKRFVSILSGGLSIFSLYHAHYKTTKQLSQKMSFLLNKVNENHIQLILNTIQVENFHGDKFP